MPRTTNLRLLAGVLATVVVLAGAGVAVRAAFPHATPAVPQIGAHFELTRATGGRVTEQSFKGKWVVLYFGYTFCPDVCPATLYSVTQALHSLGPLADSIQPVFVTLDPARDSADVIAEYVKDFDPRFVGLVGSADEVAAAARAFHVYYAVRALGNDEYVIDHSSFIYVLDPSGRFVRLLTGNLPGHQLADELRKLMS